MTQKVSIDIAVLRRFSPLDGLRRQNLAALAKKADLQSIPEGQPLFLEGSTDKRTYYLVRGTVDLRSGTAVVDQLHGGTPAATHAIAPGNPRRVSAYATTAIEALVIDSDLLDMLLTWDQTGIYDVNEVSTHSPVETGDWMTILLQTKAFQRIPPANLQAIFMRLAPVKCRAGEVVIKQDDEGDFFYAITAGRCSVTREHPVNRSAIKLAELGPGDSFGEEALISGLKRSAAVTMLTDGALVRLSKDDFNALLKEPILERIPLSDAEERVTRNAAQWLDVRLPAEFQASHLKGAINLPLYLIRRNLTQLDPNMLYVVVCDTGRRSSVGAFILGSRGYHAVLLEGGMPPAGEVRGQ